MSRVGVSVLGLYEIYLVPGDLNRLEFCLLDRARLNSSRAAESEGVENIRQVSRYQHFWYSVRALGIFRLHCDR